MTDRRSFVLHDHRKPQPHFDLRLEEDGVLKSWALPRGLPTDPAKDRLAVAVPDHDLDHLTYTDAEKFIADIGWWHEDDRNDKRLVFILHDVEGFTHEEIGTMLGVTAGGCKAQLHRARLLLREALTR